MSEYSIRISGEKEEKMETSGFFQIALDLINTETKKLESFCDTLDKKPQEKKSRIAEYKCAKYRYAGATTVWCRFFHSHRVAAKNANHHYLLPDINEAFISIPEYVVQYENAADDEKQDFALYYGHIAFADSEIAKLKSKAEHATDWERVELEERIGGLRFAKECLKEAWQRRKEVIG